MLGLVVSDNGQPTQSEETKAGSPLYKLACKGRSQWVEPNLPEANYNSLLSNKLSEANYNSLL